MGDPLATTDMGRKLEAVPLFGGPHLTQCGLGRVLHRYQVASWFIQPFGHHTPTSETDRQDQSGQRSYSIRQTVLQTIVQKLNQSVSWKCPYCQYVT